MNEQVKLGELLSRRLELISTNPTLLNQCLRGIERECLRVTTDGKLSLTPHPFALGSPLTNKQITTDYSESLLEFITSAQPSAKQVLEELEEIHRFTYSKIGSECLWNSSMPCILPHDESIPIAEYGQSNIAKFKHIYRKGLALRYGRSMQCIAGLHYNYSLPEPLWSLLSETQNNNGISHSFQSAAYMGLIRNFHRYGWILMYLFGASPALNARFIDKSTHQLKNSDPETLYLPYATSLRMSEFGYQSKVQSTLKPCLNSLCDYTTNLREAVSTPYPPYVDIGTHNNGEWIQLNTNILQIENEYYSIIRPKRTPNNGEQQLHALDNRGVQYVEIRCLDNNPFLPMGIDLHQILFLDAFILLCALDESPLMDSEEYMQNTNNFLTVAKEGRKPNLRLQRGGKSIKLKDWADELLEYVSPIAKLLDSAQGGQEHLNALYLQKAKVDDAYLTPSAQILAQMLGRERSFNCYTLKQSQKHAESFRSNPLSNERELHFDLMAWDSLIEQSRIERQDSKNFSLFVRDYQSSFLNK